MCVGAGIRHLMSMGSGGQGKALTQITVSGAGSADANGVYTQEPAEYNGKIRLFKHDGGPTPSYGHYLTWDGAQWIAQVIGGAIITLYTNPSTAAEPPETGWTTDGGIGDAPAPTLSY